MGLFKSRKSVTYDAPSPNKRNSTLEASDVVGAAPEFGSRRGASHASDTASILSRNSNGMKKLFGSTRRKGAPSIDADSSAPPSKNLGSDYFNSTSSKRDSRSSLHQPAAILNTPPVITPSAISPSLSSPAGGESSFAQAISQSVSGGLASPAAPSGPRPSELFAGKGVQWNAIDLTSRDITKPTDAATTSVDLQKFLKERRQWIPTFKDSEAVEEAPIDLPKSLDQFSFDTPAEVTKSSAGLKDLRDLEDTHKRKAALLNPAPLASAADGTIFEEAGPSSSIVPSASGSVATLPPTPAQPSRNQSFRVSSFAKKDDSAAPKTGSVSRKPAPTLGLNEGGAPLSTSASRDITQQRTSLQKERADPAAETDSPTEQGRPANGRVDQIKDRAGAAESPQTRPGTANGSIRPSIDTAGFATPTGSQTHETEPPTSNTPAALEVPKTPVGAAQEATQDSLSTIAPPTSPPRPPKSISRQSSREPVSNGVRKSSSASFAPLEPVRSPANDVVQAAPALQTIVPGTGAAVNRQA
ncbi:hypothetical protein PSEUBRA_003184 [Kalmanozyma brasiliensis GHG001]|uniref:uncharacterized protein n=1 Tax=Kalmanozyma brasiliensis (strain GHG001) TaxID=1365824 RepID=UPI001CE92F82|nr:uncharacterized protein PSEUBRA_003184 [Kalmanozyma brasiliensis GHG001]KAF6767197.1 hypothetical protein PSEUBRA_003184 [Kalmanozyma brasiliensis GHG001]